MYSNALLTDKPADKEDRLVCTPCHGSMKNVWHHAQSNLTAESQGKAKRHIVTLPLPQHLKSCLFQKTNADKLKSQQARKVTGNKNPAKPFV